MVTKIKGNTWVEGRDMILAAFATKGYKSWVAREGYGAQTTLLKDGKVIGLCTDEGNGGEVDLRADTLEARTMVFEFVKSLPPYNFNDYWEAVHGENAEDFLGKDHSSLNEMKHWQVFDFTNVILEHAEEDKQLRKICKTKTVIKVVGEDGFRTFGTAWPKYNKERRDWFTTEIAKQFDAFEIVNERYA